MWIVTDVNEELHLHELTKEKNVHPFALVPILFSNGLKDDHPNGFPAMNTQTPSSIYKLWVKVLTDLQCQIWQIIFCIYLGKSSNFKRYSSTKEDVKISRGTGLIFNENCQKLIKKSPNRQSAKTWENWSQDVYCKNISHIFICVFVYIFMKFPLRLREAKGKN